MSNMPFNPPPGMVSDETVFAAPGRWRRGSWVRFWEGNWQIKGGWERLFLPALGGVCRAVFGWQDRTEQTAIAFGLHNGLKYWQGGALSDITPALEFLPVTLPASAVNTTISAPQVTIVQNAHPWKVGQSMTLSGIGVVGGIVPNGTFPIAFTSANTWTFNYPGTAAVLLAANPLSVVTGTPTVTVAQANHGLLVGQLVTIAGAAAIGGITPNGTFAVVSVPNANSWTYTFSANATSTVANAGGAAVTWALPANANNNSAGVGPAITVQNNTPWVPGQIDGTGGAGYSTGAFGIGTYGTPSLDDYFPLTWSLAAFGGDLLANPRGKTIYTYKVGDPRAVPLANAPRRVTYMTVAPSRQVLAFGCNQSVDGVFNPLAIRWSDIENSTVWTETSANNAGEWILESGGRIVTARMVGDYALVWTSMSLFLGTFVGDPGQTWKFERVGANCGAIGPGAPIIKSQNAAWIAPDKQLWTYSLGAEPVILDCSIRNMFMDHISTGQDDKIVGSTVSTWSELTWFYPDSRDGLENSRAITVGKGGWYPDLIARTAFMDAGPANNPVGVDPAGFAYWHEKGQSADGGILQAFLESTDFYVANADGGVMVNGIWPDFKNQVGVAQLTIYGRQYPQSQERTYGPMALAPGLEQKSFRLANRILRVRMDFASAPCYARGGNPQFDVSPIGGR